MSVRNTDTFCLNDALRVGVLDTPSFDTDVVIGLGEGVSSEDPYTPGLLEVLTFGTGMRDPSIPHLSCPVSSLSEFSQKRSFYLQKNPWWNSGQGEVKNLTGTVSFNRHLFFPSSYKVTCIPYIPILFILEMHTYNIHSSSFAGSGVLD